MFSRGIGGGISGRWWKEGESEDEENNNVV